MMTPIYFSTHRFFNVHNCYLRCDVLFMVSKEKVRNPVYPYKNQS